MMLCFGIVGRRMDRIKILGIPFHNVTANEMIEELTNKIESGTKCFTVTANPEIVMYAQKDEKFKSTIENADYIVPDGIGIIIGSKIIKEPLKERVAGFDLMMSLLEISNQKHYRVYFLGAKDHVVKKAVENCQKQFPHLKIAGYHHGYFDMNDNRIVENIRMVEPDLIFVALGFPKQEFWISKHFAQFQKGVFMGVGGSFDVLAGEVKRAPKMWRDLHLEWFYRLLKQPSRWRRMLVLPKFLLDVATLRLHKKGKAKF